MIIVAFFASAVITGLLLALAARTQGIDHNGVLVAIGVVGAGIQMIVLITWYLHHTSEKTRRREAAPLRERVEPNTDRIDGR